MRYKRPVSVCDTKASDLAGEIVAALSAASLVFKEEKKYSLGLIQAAEKLYENTGKEDQIHRAETYTNIDACGGEARKFYNSSGYKDELVWGGTWLFFATGNHTYLDYATTNFAAAAKNETIADKGIFYWNNKLTANAVWFFFFFLRFNLYIWYIIMDAKFIPKCMFFVGFVDKTSFLSRSWIST